MTPQAPEIVPNPGSGTIALLPPLPAVPPPFPAFPPVADPPEPAPPLPAVPPSPPIPAPLVELELEFELLALEVVSVGCDEPPVHDAVVNAAANKVTIEIEKKERLGMMN